MQQLLEVASICTERRLTWNDAKLYCFALGEGWRLPSIAELCALNESNLYFTRHKWYWTAEECDDTDLAWIVDTAAIGNPYRFIKTEELFVRAVRGEDGITAQM